MKLAVDARWYRTGLGCYTRNLMSRLKSSGKDLHLHGIVSDASTPYVASLCDSLAKVTASAYSIREQWQVAFAARNCDILHVPQYNAPLFYRGPLVVSIHDLIHLSVEGHRGRPAAWLYARSMLRLVTRRADHLITVSEYSKKRIMEDLRVPASKITVIPNGVGSGFVNTDAVRSGRRGFHEWAGQRPYFLSVSSLRPHKNLPRLLEAATLFWQKTRNDWGLVIVGDGELRERNRIVEISRRLGVSDRVHILPILSEDSLQRAYAYAEFLVMPSLEEGFGLPVLEAMASGTPVVCSRTSSLPEIADDAASYFDPLDPDDMARAMQVVLNGLEATRMRARGRQRAAMFTWERSARMHYEVYEKVLQN